MAYDATSKNSGYTTTVRFTSSKFNKAGLCASVEHKLNLGAKYNEKRIIISFIVARLE